MRKIQLVWICISAPMVLALENVSSPAHVQPDVDGLKSAVLLKTFDKSILFMHVGAYGVKPV